LYDYLYFLLLPPYWPALKHLKERRRYNLSPELLVKRKQITWYREQIIDGSKKQ